MDLEQERPITLQEQLNICWEERMDNFPLVYDCKELVGLETYLKYLARGGQVIAVQTDGPMKPFYEEGQCLYLRRFSECLASFRAEPFLLGSDEYINLEVYVNAWGNSLKVETPAIRG